MKVAIMLVVSSFVCLILYMGLVGPYGDIVQSMETASQDHLTGDNLQFTMDNLALFQWAFGLAFIIFMGGGIVAAIVESHRREHEEFRYYERYR